MVVAHLLELFPMPDGFDAAVFKNISHDLGLKSIQAADRDIAVVMNRHRVVKVAAGDALKILIVNLDAPIDLVTFPDPDHIDHADPFLNKRLPVGTVGFFNRE